MELGPTGSDTGHSWSLLSSGCDRSRYYRVAQGTRLIPNNIHFHRTLVACLIQSPFNFFFSILTPPTKGRGHWLEGPCRREKVPRTSVEIHT